MKELDSKQRAFVLYAAKVLKCNSPEELDKKLQGLSEDELNNLVQSFDQLYNQQMENNTIMARLGSKLNYIQKLNNKCPEGYEIEYYQAGGNICTRCKQKGAIPMAAKKNGGVAKDIKAEIAKCGCKTKKKKAENGTVLDKCGGKAKKKKMQEGGKSTANNYDEHEHAVLIEKFQKGQIKDGSPESERLGELNRNSGHHDDGWWPKKDPKRTNKKVTPEQAKKASENIKKHLNGGLIQKYFRGGATSPVTTSKYDFDQSIFNSKNRTPNDIRKVQDNTYLIPTPDSSHGDGAIKGSRMQEYLDNKYNLPYMLDNIFVYKKDVIDNAGTPPSYITKYDNVLPEIVVEAPRKRINPMGGGLYQWMVENGLQSLASFKERKRLAAQYGIPNYIGTAQQNAELQEKLDFDLRQAETSGGRLGLRKGLDY